MIFFAPETALLRNQKEWTENGELPNYLSAFILFSVLKLALHFGLILIIISVYGLNHWLIYGIIFSVITQQIQLSEIVRIYMRMELQQRFVAIFELLSKLTLFLLCLMLFKLNSLGIYFIIYFIWSFVISLTWLIKLKKRIFLRLIGVKSAVNFILKASLGFSIWTHFSGILTYYIYNANLLFLDAFNAPTQDIALYTVISKISNLFFVIPMFFQSFVPVVLSNAGTNSNSKFKKLLISNAGLSFLQFIFFAAVGWWLAPFFGLKDPSKTLDFYYLGLIVSGGVLILNLSRPISTYLMIKTPPNKVMQFVFFPSAIIATGLYALGIFYAGLLGCAIGSALTYTFMAIMLVVLYFKHLKTHTNLTLQT